jgi:hypothetical protein
MAYHVHGHALTSAWTITGALRQLHLATKLTPFVMTQLVIMGVIAQSNPAVQPLTFTVISACDGFFSLLFFGSYWFKGIPNPDRDSRVTYSVMHASNFVLQLFLSVTFGELFQQFAKTIDPTVVSIEGIEYRDALVYLSVVCGGTALYFFTNRRIADAAGDHNAGVASNMGLPMQGAYAGRAGMPVPGMPTMAGAAAPMMPSPTDAMRKAAYSTFAGTPGYY